MIDMNNDRGEDGASAVEYALLAAAVAALVVVIVFALGGLVTDLFSDTCSKIDNEMSTASASCT